jgi:hypothetical protein
LRNTVFDGKFDLSNVMFDVKEGVIAENIMF